nr:MAG TPA: hypothetical protein [Caudoviricetes sp.]DAO01636.1 MAG TPA: hypothetical protein [Caudoviricetes sp.]DAX99140.1 MAG TPA: hypothetical protein [Caudoviricetes sp.]
MHTETCLSGLTFFFFARATATRIGRGNKAMIAES